MDRTLGLVSNTISDVSPLSGLKNLEDLNLHINVLSAVFLSDMPNLKDLSFSGNSLSKVSLSDMPNLEYLSLSGDVPSEVSLSDMPNLKGDSLFLGRSVSKLSLSGCTNMTSLNLQGLSISEISLLDMPNLTTLYLSDNAISDVSGLSELPNLKELWLYDNPLDYTSRSVYIPAMHARGIFIGFDERVSPLLVKVSGEDQVGLPGTQLPTPLVVQALDVEDRPLSGVSIKFTVAQGRGQLSTTIATTDANGNAQTTLTLGPDPGTNTVAVIADADETQLTLKVGADPGPHTDPVVFEKAVSFTATGSLDAPSPVQITADVNGDGVVNIQDLVIVSSNLGKTGEHAADVNGDGVVNIQDLVKVSAALQ